MPYIKLTKITFCTDLKEIVLLPTFCYYCLQFREIEKKILGEFDDDDVDVVCNLFIILISYCLF